MLQASDVVARARLTLIDPDEDHWSQAELYDYLSAAQRAVCQLKPSAYTRTEFISLRSGVVQELDRDVGLQIFDLYFNQSGRGCTHVGRELLTEMTPQWAAATQAADVENWMSDQRDPRRFLVFPPNNGSGRVMACFGALPPVVDISTGSVIVVPETFDMALWASVVAQALAKNSRRQDLGKSQIFFGIFTGLVTGRMQAQQVNAPRIEVTERA